MPTETSLRRLLCLPVLILFALLAQTAMAEPVVVRVQALEQAPLLDGQGEDWLGVQAVQVPLLSVDRGGETYYSEVLIKAGTRGDQVYFWISWADASPSISADRWSLQSLQRNGLAADDRFTLKFDVRGYAPDWRSGWNLAADTWHWQASRARAEGVVYDKASVVSREQVTPASASGDDDRGGSAQAGKLVRLASVRQDLLSAYELGDRERGSLHDVQSHARWAKGVWQVELKRALKTGHDDDIAFVHGHSYEGNLALMAAASPTRAAPDQPALSDRIVFQFD